MTALKRLKPAADEPLNFAGASFLDCLKSSTHVREPFDYWLLSKVLPAQDVDDIVALPFDPPKDQVFNGRRETNNSTRVYFTPDHQARFPVCRRVVEAFNHPDVRRAIETTTGADLSDGHLRIEYCQDAPGFWLEPHTDIRVKKFTMLVYLLDDPALARAGTDIHEGPPDFTYLLSAPYGRNLGVIFIPGDNSWHAAGHHSFEGIRKSLIINYVTSAWREKWELA